MTHLKKNYTRVGCLLPFIQSKHATVIVNVYSTTKKPITPFSGELWKKEVRNENTFIPYSLTISSASIH